MTPAQIRLAMIPLVRRLIASGVPVTGFDGLDGDLGQLSFAAPPGISLSVTLPITTPVLNPLTPVVAEAQGLVRAALRPFEGSAGLGFGPRGWLTVAEPGSLPSAGAP